MTNFRFVFFHLNWAFSKVRRVVLLLLLCVIYWIFCNSICGELVNFHKYSICIRKQDLFSIISVQIRTSYLLCCLGPLYPYLFPFLLPFSVWAWCARISWFCLLLDPCISWGFCFRKVADSFCLTFSVNCGLCL